MIRTYEDMRYWALVHDVVSNRCKIANQLHNCRYDRNYANPCKLEHKGGTYTLTLYGEVITTYSLYDVEEVESSLEMASLITNLLWLGCSKGYMRLSPMPRDAF